MMKFVESDMLNLMGDVRCECVVVLSCAWSCASCARCSGVGAAATMTRPVLFCISHVCAHRAVVFSVIFCTFVFLQDSAISSVYA